MDNLPNPVLFIEKILIKNGEKLDYLSTNLQKFIKISDIFTKKPAYLSTNKRSFAQAVKLIHKRALYTDVYNRIKTYCITVRFGT